MSSYTFYDTNIFGDCNEEYDIQGEKYIELLKLCFKFSATFSFMIYGGNKRAVLNSIPKALEMYELEPCDNVIDNYFRYSGKIIKYYKACPETYELLLGMNDSIFKWITNVKPEDLAFYREDGSIFFSSVIHDGECSLFPRENEDISSMLELENWYFVDNERRIFKL